MIGDLGLKRLRPIFSREQPVCLQLGAWGGFAGSCCGSFNNTSSRDSPLPCPCPTAPSPPTELRPQLPGNNRKPKCYMALFVIRRAHLLQLSLCLQISSQLLASISKHPSLSKLKTDEPSPHSNSLYADLRLTPHSPTGNASSRLSRAADGLGAPVADTKESPE